MEKVITDVVEQFKKEFADKCTNELASLAYFHLYFFDMLAEKMNKHGIRITKQTIVSDHIDKSPIVNFRINHGNCSCELGDFFFVRKHEDANKAVLIQAKQNQLSYKGKSTEHEFLLYDHWPELSVTKPKAMSAHYKAFSERHTVSRFLTFFERDKFIRIGNSSEQNMSFADFFMDFISPCSETGKIFCTKDEIRKNKITSLCGGLYNQYDQEWSRLVNSLLDYFATKQFRNKSTGIKQKQISTEFNFIALENDQKAEIDLKKYLQIVHEDNLAEEKRVYFRTLIIIE